MGLQERRDAQQTRLKISSVIAEAGYEIVFQPIVDLVTSKVSCREALCRFVPLPYRSPDQWFADASSVGLGVDLELAVLQAALETFPTLPDAISMSVNASPDLVISGELAKILPARYADRTIIEITEHAKVASYADLHRQLAPLKEIGVRVAVDDAGAGYSGLQHIIQLAPDIIKIDMSLTRAVDSDPARRALASAMVFYAREMGVSVVAEGIETEPELRTLKLLGANRGQGYFIGRPGSLASLVASSESPVQSAA